MIVLDTDVLSETFKSQPDRHVVDWLNAQTVADVWITSVTVMEVISGIEAMPEGQRRRNLEFAALDTLRVFWKGRVLDFDEPLPGLPDVFME